MVRGTLLLMGACALFITGCGVLGDSDAYGIEDVPWALQSYSAPDGAKTDVIEGTNISAHFGEGKINGRGGCNGYFGTYTLPGDDAITIGPLASTQMFCEQPEGVMDQEAAYLAVVSTADSYRTGGQNLELRNGDTVVATYRAAPVSLSGVIWIATGINNGKEAVVSVVVDTEVTAEFGEDGALSGSAGCNTYSGTYETSGDDELSIGSVASTMMFCEPAEKMDQEAMYLANLENIATYEIADDVLTVRDADGATLVTYIAG